VRSESGPHRGLYGALWWQPRKARGIRRAKWGRRRRKWGRPQSARAPDAAPVPGIGAPGRRISAPAPNGGATIWWREAPATAPAPPPLAATPPPQRPARPPREMGAVFSEEKAPFQAKKRPLEAKSVELGGRTSSSRASGVMAELRALPPRGERSRAVMSVRVCFMVVCFTVSRFALSGLTTPASPVSSPRSSCSNRCR